MSAFAGARPRPCFIYGNIVFGRDHADAWGAYRLSPQSYTGLSVARKLRVMGQLEGFIKRAQADFQILRIARPWTVSDYLASTWRTFDRRNGSAEEIAERESGFRRLLESHAEAMGDRLIVRPDIYLLVRLGEAPGALGGLAGGDSFRSLARRLSSAVGIGDPRGLRYAQLHEIERAEQRIHSLVFDFLEAERALASEVAWLVRHAYTRGLGEASLERNFEPQGLAILDERGGEIGFEPLEWEMARLHCDHRVRVGARHLEIESEGGTSYQAALACGPLPEEREFPGPEAELMFAPVDLEFPVDAALWCEYLPNREAQRLARKRVLDADQIWREEAGSDHGASPEGEDRPAEARELQRRLGDNDQPPLLRAGTFYFVSSTEDTEQLEERVERLRSAVGDRIELHRPLALQHDLFLAGLPAIRPRGSAYREHLLPEEVAAMVPSATTYAGSEIGTYIGYTLTPSRMPVRFDLAEPLQQSHPAPLLMTGASGCGRTTFMSLLEYQSFWQGSAPIVHIDPKGTPEEPDHKLHLFPEIAAEMERVLLSGEERYRGLIDPLRVAEPDIRGDAAFSFAVDILPAPVPSAWQTEIRAAIEVVCSEPGRDQCLGEVAAVLAQGDEPAREAARALEVHGNAGLAKLAFGLPGRAVAEVGSARVIVFQIKNLELPRAGTARSEMLPEERLGAALLRLIAAYALRLCTATRERHSVLGMDEAWVLFETSVGRMLLERMARLGRSRNATSILATQLVVEAEGISGLIGAIATGGVKTEEEAKRSLRLLGEDDQDPNQIERLMRFEKGRFLLRDYEGQTVPMQVDLCEARMREILRTDPPPRGGGGAESATSAA